MSQNKLCICKDIIFTEGISQDINIHMSMIMGTEQSDCYSLYVLEIEK
jgi:hypothetical protein